MPRTSIYPPRRDIASRATQHCLILLVPGNPGYIDYYRPFLSTLRGLLDREPSKDTEETVAFHLVGCSLLGFDDAGGRPPIVTKGPPWDLEDQVDGVAEVILELDRHHRATTSKFFDHIVLMGHSVGAFIVLEIFRLWLDPHGPNLSSNIRWGILLFPTISHLRQSPAGQRFQRLFDAPFVGDNAHHLAKALLRPFPAWALRWFLGRWWGFPPHAADTTTKFLCSPGGIHQALYLARDELRIIADLEWEDEENVWESGRGRYGASGLPQFFMLFGKNDHWVSNEHRDRFIAKRREGNPSPYGWTSVQRSESARIIIDEGRLPHDFCINHSEMVAEMVKSWVDEIRTACRDSDT